MLQDTIGQLSPETSGQVIDRILSLLPPIAAVAIVFLLVYFLVNAMWRLPKFRELKMMIDQCAPDSPHVWLHGRIDSWIEGLKSNAAAGILIALIALLIAILYVFAQEAVPLLTDKILLTLALLGLVPSAAIAFTLKTRWQDIVSLPSP